MNWVLTATCFRGFAICFRGFLILAICGLTELSAQPTREQLAGIHVGKDGSFQYWNSDAAFLMSKRFRTVRLTFSTQRTLSSQR